MPVLATVLALAAIGLAACGGSSATKSVSKSASAEPSSGQSVTSAPASTGTTASSGTSTHASTSTRGGSSTSGDDGRSTSTSTDAGSPASSDHAGSTSTSHHTSSGSPTRTPTHTKVNVPPGTKLLPVVTTIDQNTLPAGYTGPSPTSCLNAAGLKQARAGVEPQVWEANFGSSSETDSNAIVFLSGPYQNQSVATNYAQSLQAVELASSGGLWVASASARSQLKLQVDSVAACMAQ